MISMNRRQEAILSEGVLPPPLKCPLLCVSILHFTFFSLLFVTSTSLPQQFTSSFVSFPEVSVSQDAVWVAKTLSSSAVAHLINLRSQFLTSNVSFPQSKACPGLGDLEAQDSTQLGR